MEDEGSAADVWKQDVFMWKSGKLSTIKFGVSRFILHAGLLQVWCVQWRYEAAGFTVRVGTRFDPLKSSDTRYRMFTVEAFSRGSFPHSLTVSGQLCAQSLSHSDGSQCDYCDGSPNSASRPHVKPQKKTCSTWAVTLSELRSAASSVASHIICGADWEEDLMLLFLSHLLYDQLSSFSHFFSSFRFVPFFSPLIFCFLDWLHCRSNFSLWLAKFSLICLCALKNVLFTLCWSSTDKRTLKSKGSIHLMTSVSPDE